MSALDGGSAGTALRPVDVPAHVGGPHVAYAELLRSGILGFQHCQRCRSAVFPARGRCHRCGADALVWAASAGRGEVYSATVIQARDADPYTVVLVDLDEGFRMMSRVDDEVAIGDRVVVRLVTVGDEVLPFFTPEEG